MHGMQNGFRCTEKGEPGERGEKGDKGSSIDGVSLEFPFFIQIDLGLWVWKMWRWLALILNSLPENNGPSSVYYRDRFQSSSPFGQVLLGFVFNGCIGCQAERSIAYYLERESWRLCRCRRPVKSTDWWDTLDGLTGLLDPVPGSF